MGVGCEEGPAADDNATTEAGPEDDVVVGVLLDAELSVMTISIQLSVTLAVEPPDDDSSMSATEMDAAESFGSLSRPRVS